MNIKLLEVRDRATCITCYAFKLCPFDGSQIRAAILNRDEMREEYLLKRAGFNPDDGLIVLGSLSDRMKAQYDMYEWGDRTFQTIHQYLIDNWDSVQSGDVLDVEFILGEVDKPKISEQITNPL